MSNNKSPGNPGRTAILASLLLPGLSKAKEKARTVVCVNNLHQLGLAWQMYPHDNNDWLVPNNPAGYGGSIGLDKISWARGDIRYGKPDGTNVAYVRDALLGPYLQTHRVFKCPSDQSKTKLSDGKAYPRVRSYTMNSSMGTELHRVFKGDIFLKTHDLPQSIRKELLVFLDTHEDFISRCIFNVPFEFNRKYWEPLPASRHNRRGVVGFADGHVEIHRWNEPTTVQPARGEFRDPAQADGSSDWVWVFRRMTTAGGGFGNPDPE